MIDLSIIIVSFNTKKLTLGCLDSLFGAKGAEGIEIVVIDNASTDGSGKTLKNYLKGYDNTTFFQNKKNLGFARAVNQGIKKAKGKYLFLLNPDTLVKDNTISGLLDFVKSTTQVGVVGVRLVNPKGVAQLSVTNFPSVVGAIRQYWLGEKGAYEGYVPEGKMPVEVDAVFGTAFLITPGAIKKVGLLNEQYFMYFEDLDYCRRVRKNGLKVYYLPTVEVIHYLGESGKNLASTKTQWKRLVPSSKIYNGAVKHFLINLVIRSGTKWQKLINRK